MIVLLDSLPISLSQDGANVRFEPRAEISRRYDGVLLSSVTTSRGYMRVWELQTPEELATDIDAIEAQLAGPGSILFSGDLVASGGVQVYPRGIVRSVGRNAAYAVLSFELWEDAALAAERQELIRIFVADDDDHLQNLSAWFVGATIQASVEAFAKTANIIFWRETPSASKAPLMNDPQPIAPGRRVFMESAVLELDEVLEESDWSYLFSGRIDDTAWGGNASQIVVPCRDPAGRLHDSWILDERTYGSNVTPVPIQTVMQAILTDNLTANPPTMNVIGDPDFGIVEYTQKRGSIQDGLFSNRDLQGWDLRYKWNYSDDELQLTYYEPDRTKTVPDHVFGVDDYFEISEVSLSALGVRNYVIVDWDPDQPAVVAEDSTSIAEYANADSDGIFPLLVDETGNAQINTQAAALALAEAILAETAFPSLSHTARNAFAPEVEIGDLCRYPANGIHYNTAQDVAIVGYTHEIRPDGNQTTIAARGSPSGSVTRWYLKHKAAVIKQQTEADVEDPPEFEDYIQWLYTEGTGPGYTRESTAAGSLGGWVSKTKVVGGLFGIFREILEAETSGGITIHRSIAIANTDPSPSPQDFECVIGFLTPDEGASGSYIFSIGVDPAGVVLITATDQQSGISPYEEAPPDTSPAIVFTSPLELESGVLDVGTIPPMYARIIHLKLEVLPGATGQYTGEALELQDQAPA